MKVVICGAGQVGFHIARYLSGEKNDVTVVDQSPELIGKINDQLDVQAFVGHASHPSVLARAGTNEADMLIAVTHGDEVNMIACQVAHTLFNVPLKIARVRQQNYLKSEWDVLFARDHLPIDVVISPEVEVAHAIADCIRMPGAADLVSMADDKVRVVGVRCADDCPVVRTPLRQLTSLFPDLQITVVCIARGERISIPEPEDEMLPGDEVYFAADASHVSRAMAVFGHEHKETRRILIVGGGYIGAMLANIINEEETDYSARIIEKDKQVARRVAETLPTTTVIHGDGLDQDILEEAAIRQTDAIVTVTDHDETNILGALLSKRFGVRRAITLVNNLNYNPLITALGVDVVISPREITTSTILRHVRQGRIRSVHSLRGGFAELIEAEALDTSGLVGQPLKETKLPDGIIIGALVRDGTVIMPRPDSVIKQGDLVVLLAVARAVRKVEKMFAVRLEYF